MKKPFFINLWNNFPLHSQFSTLKDLYTWLGGQVERNINIRGFGESGNACASRMSVAPYNGINYREPTYDDYSTYVKESNPKIKTKRSLFWEIS